MMTAGELAAVEKRHEEFKRCGCPSHKNEKGVVTYQLGEIEIGALLAEVKRLTTCEFCGSSVSRGYCGG